MHLLEPIDDTTTRDTWKKSKAVKSGEKGETRRIIYNEKVRRVRDYLARPLKNFPIDIKSN